jgi:hypothetical protein
MKRTTDSICDRCLQLDFEKAFQSDPANIERQAKRRRNSIMIANLSSWDKSDADCSMCSLLHTICGEDPRLNSYHLIACFPDGDPPVSDRPMYLELRDNYNSEKLLCFSQEHDDKNDSTPRQIATRFEASRAVRWIDNCKQYHRDCDPNAGEKELSRYWESMAFQVSTDLQELRVIDCHSLEIVPAPLGVTYVALSYVWGQSKAAKSDTSKGDKSQTATTSRLPSDVPGVISDSVTVAKALGFRYLWVDRYCISQTDEASKALQISQMDLVYRTAELTIIAAAGEGEDYGLPGVGDRPRIPPPAVTIGTSVMTGEMVDPQHSIEFSKWATRGWTVRKLGHITLVFDHLS